MAIFTTFTGAYYFAGLGLSQIFRKKLDAFIYALLPVIYITAMIPENLGSAFRMGDLIGLLGTLASVLIPFVVLLVALIRRKGSEKNLNEE